MSLSAHIAALAIDHRPRKRRHRHIRPPPPSGYGGDELNALTNQSVHSVGADQFDGNGRQSRWLRDGLHTFDFPILRTRPLWDIVVLPLLALVTFIWGTGTWMGFKRLGRDWRRTRRRWRKVREAVSKQVQLIG